MSRVDMYLIVRFYKDKELPFGVAHTEGLAEVFAKASRTLYPHWDIRVVFRPKGSGVVAPKLVASFVN